MPLEIATYTVVLEAGWVGLAPAGVRCHCVLLDSSGAVVQDDVTVLVAFLWLYFSCVATLPALHAVPAAV